MAERRTEAGKQAKMRYNEDYNKTAYQSLHIRVRKGMRDEYKAAADSLGLSLAGLVTSAVDDYISRKIKK
ncbi:hypothetical protein [Selenomonas ruminantium]|uniref:hypothetical protein n=1 Tax=Selenomonas ruminantium TaxID=971 RepID=UPI0026EC325A|nr:hypothetical protein [Selenomonas ruminantium]